MISEDVAMSMAEGDPRFKMDVSLVFGSQKRREKVLRTCLDSLEHWTKKYVGVSKSPFERYIDSVKKKAAIIDKEVWVFGIDSTLSGDIVAAVKIASEWYGVSPQLFMRNIYAKNLNANSENTMSEAELILANKQLYTGVSLAIQEAAKILKVSGEIDFWVMSNNANPKIPRNDLHDALRDGGAQAVAVAKRRYRYTSGSNDGEDQRLLITNLHLGKFRV